MEENKENKERYGIIYKITNTVNGKCYIGQTTDKRGFKGRYSFSGKGIERVYKYHKNNKEHNRHYNIYLLRSIEKYGLEAFIVDEEFDVAYSKEELDTLEKRYIKEFDCIENGYNNTDGGSNGKPSEEVCKKISEKTKEKMNNPDVRRKISKKAKERFKNPEEKRKMSEKAKERWSNPEERRKISEARKGKYCGENHPMYGKHHTEEEKRKMSKKAKERWSNPDKRRKQSESLKGKFTGENSPLYGKHRTEEEKMKISEARKGKYCGKNNPMARKIICIADGNTFNTLTECAEYYKLNINTIVKICKGITKKSRSGLVFMYYDEWLKQKEQQDKAAI